MAKNQKEKFQIFLSDQQIHDDLEKAARLLKSGVIVEKTVPDQWTVGTSSLKWATNLYLAIFLGFFGIDRFYLKKYISGVTKAFLILVVTPFFLWLILDTSVYELYPDVVVIFAMLCLGAAAGFYFFDIYFALTKPRDAQFLLLVR